MKPYLYYKNDPTQPFLLNGSLAHYHAGKLPRPPGSITVKPFIKLYQAVSYSIDTEQNLPHVAKSPSHHQNTELYNPPDPLVRLEDLLNGATHVSSNLSYSQITNSIDIFQGKEATYLEEYFNAKLKNITQAHTWTILVVKGAKTPPYFFSVPYTRRLINCITNYHKFSLSSSNSLQDRRMFEILTNRTLYTIKTKELLSPKKYQNLLRFTDSLPIAPLPSIIKHIPLKC